GKALKEASSDAGQQAHARNVLDAVRTRTPDTLNHELYPRHPSTELRHAGNRACRTGKKLRFHPETETFDDEEANRYVGREHRKGFELPDIA
ncbi:MAG: gfo/Idh/MocA family oxidoreductase, partial [Planctomycetes bacterium]|nr:gfo/Idh/MocA family oxidoreductase [Planctomycetota bacterium]